MSTQIIRAAGTFLATAGHNLAAGVLIVPGNGASSLGDNSDSTTVNFNTDGLTATGYIVCEKGSWTKPAHSKITQITVNMRAVRAGSGDSNALACNLVTQNPAGTEWILAFSGTHYQTTPYPSVQTFTDTWSCPDLTQEQLDQLRFHVEYISYDTTSPGLADIWIEITYVTIGGTDIVRTVILNPQTDITSAGWIPSAGAGTVDVIGDRVPGVTAGSLSLPAADYIYSTAGGSGIWEMTTFTLESHEKITSVKVYARMRKHSGATTGAIIVAVRTGTAAGVGTVVDTHTLTAGSGTFTIQNATFSWAYAFDQNEIDTMKLDLIQTGDGVDVTEIWIEIQTSSTILENTSNAIVFTGTATGAKASPGISSITFTGTAAGNRGESLDVSSEITFGSEATFGPNTWNRSANNAIVFGQSASGFISNRPVCDDYDANLGTSTRLLLEYPVASPSSSVELRVPRFGNSLSLDKSLRIKRTIAGCIRVTRKSTWPTTERNSFSFENLTIGQVDDLIVFHDETAGLTIKLTDHENVSWSGIIETPILNVTQVGRNNQFNTEFVFRGTRL